ncbi:MAG: sensor histidine kinase [Luteibaculaceae bacterium]
MNKQLLAILTVNDVSKKSIYQEYKLAEFGKDKIQDSTLMVFLMTKIEEQRYINPLRTDTACLIIKEFLADNKFDQKFQSYINLRHASTKLNLRQLIAAEVYAKSAQEGFYTINKEDGIAATYNILGVIYALKSDYIEASNNFLKAAKFYDQDFAETEYFASAAGYVQGISNFLVASQKAGITDGLEKYILNVALFRQNDLFTTSESEILLYLIAPAALSHYYYLNNLEKISEIITQLYENNAGEIKIDHKQYNVHTVNLLTLATQYYLDINQKSKAIKIYESAKTFFKENPGDPQLLTNLPIAKSKILLYEGKNEEALNILFSALENPTLNNLDDNKRDILLEIFETQKTLGKTKDALNTLKDIMQMETRVFNEEKINLNSLLTAEFNDRLLNQEIKLTDQKTAENIRQEQLAKQGMVLISLILAVSVGMLLFFSFTLRKIDKKLGVLKNNNTLLVNNNRLRDQIFSITGHDLRLPFVNLSQVIQLLEKDEEIPQKERQELFKEIKNRTEQVLLTLDNLLAWGVDQSKSNSASKTKFMLSSVLEDCINNFQDDISTKNITINNYVPRELEVTGGRETLSIILRNLISNAIKFSLKGGTIKLQYEKTEKQHVIQIIDYGVGFSQENLDLLNSKDEIPFLNYGTSNEKGAGIGISLAKLQVAKINGSLRYSNTLPQGCTVTLKFSIID